MIPSRVATGEEIIIRFYLKIMSRVPCCAKIKTVVHPRAIRAPITPASINIFIFNPTDRIHRTA